MKTTNWTSQLDKNTHLFRDKFGKLDGAVLNSRPNPQTWSIAQNVEHIMKVNSTYYNVIDAIRNGIYTTPFIAKIPLLPKMIGKFILNSVQPDRKRKIKTFPIWEPTESDIAADVIERFARDQDKLKSLIHACRDLLNSGMVISSPAHRQVVYPLSTAFDIILAHEQRHFVQASLLLQE